MNTTARDRMIPTALREVSLDWRLRDGIVRQIEQERTSRERRRSCLIAAAAGSLAIGYLLFG